jgi:hypothetical protein
MTATRSTLTDQRTSQELADARPQDEAEFA